MPREHVVKMKLDATVLRYLTGPEIRVLTAVEMGMKNHEYVSKQLIAQISNLKRQNVNEILSTLLKHKLLSHMNIKYDGYKLTYNGYDILALKTFVRRDVIESVGMRMGVGKESDIHLCKHTDGRILCLKFHRLGRVSFRAVKTNRDYLKGRSHASWMYLARLAALKEFTYMKLLHENKFEVPEPIDLNRHVILMEYVDACPLYHVKTLENPLQVLETLMKLIVRLANAGLIHGDFNEFNLMIDDEQKITLIDFPQIVSTKHPNAELYFQRDVNCIKRLFEKKFGIVVLDHPTYAEIVGEKASEMGEQLAHPNDMFTHDEEDILGAALEEAIHDDSHVYP